MSVIFCILLVHLKYSISTQFQSFFFLIVPPPPLKKEIVIKFWSHSSLDVPLQNSALGRMMPIGV